MRDPLRPILLGALLAAHPFSGHAREVDARARLGARALALLHKAMVHEEGDVRVLAAEQWGPIGNRAAVPVLKRALADPDPYVRIAAAGSLYQLDDFSGVAMVEAVVSSAPSPSKGGDLEVVEQMRALARNKVRVVGIRVLGLMRSPSSLKVLAKTRQDQDGAVRDASLLALAKLGMREGLERFVAALEDEDPQIRAKAARELGEIGTPAVLGYLKPLASDPSYPVRAAVMESLGATGDVVALPELIDGLKDQNELVRAKAAAALGRIQSPSAIPFLEEALKSPNPFIELLATAGLARQGRKVGGGLARSSLAQNDMDFRLLAVEVLEAVGGEEAVEGLELALDDREMRVRVRAAAALVRILQKPAAKAGPR